MPVRQSCGFSDPDEGKDRKASECIQFIKCCFGWYFCIVKEVYDSTGTWHIEYKLKKLWNKMKEIILVP